MFMEGVAFDADHLLSIILRERGSRLLLALEGDAIHRPRAIVRLQNAPVQLDELTNADVGQRRHIADRSRNDGPDRRGGVVTALARACRDKRFAGGRRTPLSATWPCRRLYRPTRKEIDPHMIDGLYSELMNLKW